MLICYERLDHTLYSINYGKRNRRGLIQKLKIPMQEVHLKWVGDLYTRDLICRTLR